MSKLGKRLIAGLEEAIDNPAGMRTVEIETADVAAIRKSLNLSQDKFAARFGLSAATVRDWEQGRRIPDRAANNYLLVIRHDPDAVTRALGKQASRADQPRPH